jgi:serine/threonine-protein kinase
MVMGQLATREGRKMTTVFADRVGTTLGTRYRLDAIIGRGGVGVVYAATHTWTGRRVAVKVLSPQYASDARIVRRFLFEARAATQLRHPNVVDVLDMGTDDGTVYLVLEYLEGRPLSEVLSDEGPLSLKRTLALLLPVISAAEAAHARGVVHRDLKPENIFVSRDYRGTEVPKLIDFGVAAAICDRQEAAATDTPNTGAQDRPGRVTGTPSYMAPEQICGAEGPTPATDVWAMGVILYECLTGAPPFRGETTLGVLTAILQGAYKPLSDFAGMPAIVTRIVDQALAFDVDERMPTMRALGMALSEASGLLDGASGRPLSSPGCRRDADTVQIVMDSRVRRNSAVRMIAQRDALVARRVAAHDAATVDDDAIAYGPRNDVAVGDGDD